MAMSQLRRALPSDTLRYLLTILAMMSVPPVLPLFMNIMASPTPRIMEPMMVDMNGSNVGKLSPKSSR